MPNETNTRPTVEAPAGVVEDFLHELDGWEAAYPLSAFPEPDLMKAAELLKAGGMTLDAVSASNMRHVVSCVAPKARTALTAKDAEIAALRGRVRELEAGLRPFVDALEEMRFDRDHRGNPFPDSDPCGWIYVTLGDFRRARALLDGGSDA